MYILCYNQPCSAGVAHPVERHLAKVEVASSSLVTRSRKKGMHLHPLFFFYGGTLCFAKSNLQNIWRISVWSIV